MLGFTATVTLYKDSRPGCFNAKQFHKNGTKISHRCAHVIKSEELISFELFLKTKKNFPFFDVDMDSAEINDWIDFVVSLSNVSVEHQFDILYFHNKIVISPMTFLLRKPEGLFPGNTIDSLLFYLNTFNSTYGTAVFSLDARKDFCCRTMFDSPFYDWHWGKLVLVKWSYSWSKEVHLSKHDPGYLISWPDFQSGLRVAVSVQRHGLNVSSMTTLTIYWIHMHQYGIHFTSLCRRFLCINYTYVRSLTENRVVTEHYYVYIMPTKQTLSWNQAIKWCQCVGGTLPIIRSKQQQEEILRFFPSLYTPPPFIIMFIGLKTSLYAGEVRGAPCWLVHIFVIIKIVFVLWSSKFAFPILIENRIPFSRSRISA